MFESSLDFMKFVCAFFASQFQRNGGFERTGSEVKSISNAAVGPFLVNQSKQSFAGCIDSVPSLRSRAVGRIPPT